MRFIAITMIMFIFMVSLAFSRPDISNVGNNIDDMIGNQNQQKTIIDSDEMPKGLQHAKVMVSNQNATQNIIRNINRFQERNQYNFSKFNEVDVEQMDNNLTRMNARHNVRFLFFNVEAKETIDFEETGEIKAQSRNVWERLYRAGIAKEVKTQ
jgi:hypothetical protein